MVQKSDFYSLFIVFAKHKDSLPLSKDKRLLVKQILSDFSDEIELSTYPMDENGKLKNFRRNVILYTQGLRASSDLGSRKRRDEALEIELKKFGKNNNYCQQCTCDHAIKRL